MSLFKRKKNDVKAGPAQDSASSSTAVKSRIEPLVTPITEPEQVKQGEVATPIAVAAEVQSIADPNANNLKAKNKNTKKIKNTLVLRKEGLFFEYIENPLGDIRLFYDPGFLSLGDWIPGIGKKMFVHVMYAEDGVLKAYTPPDELNNMPSNLYDAVMGCESYSKLLSPKNKMLEKIQIGLLFGILAMLAFIIFLMVSK